MFEPIQDNDKIYKPHAKNYSNLYMLSRKQESVTDGQTDRWTDGRYYYISSPLSLGDNNTKIQYKRILINPLVVDH